MTEQQTKQKETKKSLWLTIISTGLGMLAGICIGIVLQQMLFIAGAIEIAEALEGTNFNVTIDINETMMMEMALEGMEDIILQINETDNLRT